MQKETKMRTTKMFFDVLVILSLVMALLGSTAIPASAGSDREAKADPRLLQLAAEHPDARLWHCPARRQEPDRE